MNIREHLLSCIGEEGVEISQVASKANRFGLLDRNVLHPTGPTNQERLVAEMNDFLGVASLLVEYRIIPAKWRNKDAQRAKRLKVLKFMSYARKTGALQAIRNPDWPASPEPLSINSTIP